MSSESHAGCAIGWAWTLGLPRSRRTGLVAKRAFDIAVSTVLLVLLAPVMALLAVAVRLTSPGPALFVQRRIGYRCAEFDMYKFRTMVPDAELEEARLVARQDGKTFLKIANDPRVTRIGRLLRKCSLDELPQLYNVLRGNMSLVGPRPLLRSDLERYPRADLMRRFAMKPGISGLWQVSGRSLLPDTARIRLDLQYVDGWSLGGDALILVKTVGVVLAGRGAL